MRLSDFFNSNSVITNCEFSNISHTISPKLENTITFVDSEIYIPSLIHSPQFVGVVCTEDIYKKIASRWTGGVAISESPRLDLLLINNKIKENQIKNESLISPRAIIGDNVFINSTNVIIEDNVIIKSGSVIRSNVTIKRNAVIGENCIIGNEGFEFKRNQKGEIFTIKHCGGVVIEENVELKELCSVHKSLFEKDNTVLGQNTKVDSGTHIGHGVYIGAHTLIGAKTNISGNTCIGDFCYIGPSCCISNRIKISSGAKISLGSVVTKNVGEGEHVTGNFAIPHNVFMKKLKEMIK